MALEVVLFSTKQKHTTNSGVEEESVLKECCKSSWRTSLFEKATKPKDTDRQLGEIASIVLHKTD